MQRPIHLKSRDVAQFVEHRTGTLPTQVRFPGAARDFFSPRVNFQCRLSYGVCTPPCAVACIYICAHVKDPVVRVRVRWIKETLKHPACTVGLVARLCRSWLSPRKATQISRGRNTNGTIGLLKEKKKPRHFSTNAAKITMCSSCTVKRVRESRI